jgi:hypothetical protein
MAWTMSEACRIATSAAAHLSPPSLLPMGFVARRPILRPNTEKLDLIIATKQGQSQQLGALLGVISTG